MESPQTLFSGQTDTLVYAGRAAALSKRHGQTREPLGRHLEGSPGVSWSENGRSAQVSGCVSPILK